MKSTPKSCHCDQCRAKSSAKKRFIRNQMDRRLRREWVVQRTQEDPVVLPAPVGGRAS